MRSHSSHSSPHSYSGLRWEGWEACEEWERRTARGCLELQEVPQQPLPFEREDRLGVKLHAVDRVLAMAQTHDLALRRLGGDFQRLGEGVAFHDERMVAR